MDEQKEVTLTDTEKDLMLDNFILRQNLLESRKLNLSFEDKALKADIARHPWLGEWQNKRFKQA